VVRNTPNHNLKEKPMCYAGGPYCATHVKPKLNNAIRAFTAQPNLETKARMDRARLEYDTSTQGIEELRKRAGEARKEGQSAKADALLTRADYCFERHLALLVKNGHATPVEVQEKREIEVKRRQTVHEQANLTTAQREQMRLAKEAELRKLAKDQIRDALKKRS
jgi:hypothetical protein